MSCAFRKQFLYYALLTISILWIWNILGYFNSQEGKRACESACGAIELLNSGMWYHIQIRPKLYLISKNIHKRTNKIFAVKPFVKTAVFTIWPQKGHILNPVLKYFLPM